MVKSLPAMWETQFRSLGRDDSLEKYMATHSSILAWKIPWTDKPGRLQLWGCKESDTAKWLTYRTVEDSYMLIHSCEARWDSQQGSGEHRNWLVCVAHKTANFSEGKHSVQFSRSVVSDSLRPHESQHARPPCPSPAPRVHPDACPSSQWCHPAISSSVVPFSSCPQPSQHQSLFKWVNSSHEVDKVLEFQL